MNSNFKSILFIEANVKTYMKIFFLLISCTFGFSESSGGWGATSEAFIFSLNNNEWLVPFVSKVKPEKTRKAIFRRSSFGPVFGYWDLFIYADAKRKSSSRACLCNYYSVPASVKDKFTNLAGTERFSPDEVEIFYLDPSG